MGEPIAIVSAEWDVVDLIDSCPEFTIAGFFETSSVCSIGEYRYLGPDESWEKVAAEIAGLKVVLAIDAPPARERIFKHYGKEAVVTLLSPHAYVSRRATVGAGSVIQRGVTVMPRARVGTACKLNVNATVHHDAVVGSYSTLAPGSQILGTVTVEEKVYVGAGAIIRQHCRIGTGAVIGAGAVVVRDVPPYAVVVGVPAARSLKRRSAE